jgi:hypothetical protein
MPIRVHIHRKVVDRVNVVNERIVDPKKAVNTAVKNQVISRKVGR